MHSNQRSRPLFHVLLSKATLFIYTGPWIHRDTNKSKTQINEIEYDSNNKDNYADHNKIYYRRSIFWIDSIIAHVMITGFVSLNKCLLRFAPCESTEFDDFEELRKEKRHIVPPLASSHHRQMHVRWRDRKKGIQLQKKLMMNSNKRKINTSQAITIR